MRLRVTLLVAAVVAGVVAVFGIGVYAVVAHRTLADVDDRLRARADSFLRFERDGQRPPVSVTTLPRLPLLFRVGPNDLGVFVLTHGSDGSVVSRSASVDAGQVRVPASSWSAATAGGDQVLTVDGPDSPYRVAVRAVPTSVAPQTAAGAALDQVSGQRVDAFAVGSSLGDQQSTMRLLAGILAGGTLLAVVLAAVGTWLVARRVLRPVSRLVAAAETIGAEGDLGRRLPVPPGRDEIGRLTVAFNGSLARVQSAFGELEGLLDRQRRFVADASHELRTPLTTVRTDLGSLRRHLDMPSRDRAVVLDEALVELDRLSRLVADLLVLARADEGVLLRAAPLSWDDLAAVLVEDAQRSCPQHPVASAVDAGLGDGAGDAEALRRAVGAVLENVTHHTPPGTGVLLGARVDGPDVVLVVEDDGPGVPDELLPRLFDRFVQADGSRHTTGTGLGLAIARGVVEAHGGSVSASAREEGGLRVELRLPRGDGSAGSFAPSPQPAALRA